MTGQYYSPPDPQIHHGDFGLLCLVLVLLTTCGFDRGSGCSSGLVGTGEGSGDEAFDLTGNTPLVTLRTRQESSPPKKLSNNFPDIAVLQTVFGYHSDLLSFDSLSVWDPVPFKKGGQTGGRLSCRWSGRVGRLRPCVGAGRGCGPVSGVRDSCRKGKDRVSGMDERGLSSRQTSTFRKDFCFRIIKTGQTFTSGSRHPEFRVRLANSPTTLLLHSFLLNKKRENCRLPFLFFIIEVFSRTVRLSLEGKNSMLCAKTFYKMISLNHLLPCHIEVHCSGRGGR